MKLLKIDEQGFFIEDVIVNEIPMISDEEGNQIPDPKYIQTPAQGGFYHPKWDGEKWVEGLSQAEIDAIINRPQPKTELELLREQIAQQQEIIDAMLNGGGN